MNRKIVFKMLLCAFLSSAVIFTACKKERNAPFKESKDYDQNVKNVMIYAKEINEYSITDIQEYTDESQRLIFDEMTPENRARIIKERLDLAIEAETIQDNIDYLVTLKSMINESIYSENANINDKIDIENYVESLIPLMGYEKIKSIVTTWGAAGFTVTTSTGGPNTTNPTSAVKCNCSKSDDWCTGIGNCANIVCLGKSWGCGTLMISGCDGKCSLGL